MRADPLVSEGGKEGTVQAILVVVLGWVGTVEGRAKVTPSFLLDDIPGRCDNSEQGGSGERSFWSTNSEHKQVLVVTTLISPLYRQP